MFNHLWYSTTDEVLNCIRTNQYCNGTATNTCSIVLSRYWAAPDRDTAHSYPVIRRSKFSVSPACHNRVTWLATSAQQLTLLAVVRSKQLCQAPRPWRHNATPWRRHIQNIAGFRNSELDTLSDVKFTGKYLLNFGFLTSRDKNKTVLLRDTVHQIFRGEAMAAGQVSPVRWLPEVDRIT